LTHESLAATLLKVVESASRGPGTEAAQLRVQLQTDAFVSASDVVGTARDVDQLLRELERLISPDHQAVAHWEWAEPDPTLEFVAYSNGASPETLQRVVAVAQDGFQKAQAGEPWPPEFSPKAQNSARSILRRLRRLESIVIQASGESPLTLTDASPGELIEAKEKQRRLFSSVDGVLRMLGETDQNVVAGLREHRTNVNVRCSFPASDEWADRLSKLWRHRVVVEGMVAYDDHRRPRSITEIKRVIPRLGPTDLRRFAGAVPDLTGGLSDDDYLAVIRRND
jgi:hypothetical protein